MQHHRLRLLSLVLVAHPGLSMPQGRTCSDVVNAPSALDCMSLVAIEFQLRLLCAVVVCGSASSVKDRAEAHQRPELQTWYHEVLSGLGQAPVRTSHHLESGCGPGQASEHSHQIASMSNQEG